jgi:hypothetical protein
MTIFIFIIFKIVEIIIWNLVQFHFLLDELGLWAIVEKPNMDYLRSHYICT